MRLGIWSNTAMASLSRAAIVNRFGATSLWWRAAAVPEADEQGKKMWSVPLLRSAHLLLGVVRFRIVLTSFLLTKGASICDLPTKRRSGLDTHPKCADTQVMNFADT